MQKKTFGNKKKKLKRAQISKLKKKRIRIESWRYFCQPIFGTQSENPWNSTNGKWGGWMEWRKLANKTLEKGGKRQTNLQQENGQCHKKEGNKRNIERN